MAWTDLVFKPEAILYTYGVAPPLTNLRVLELDLNGYNGVLAISLELSCFPLKPPTKWLMRGLDCVVIKFHICEIYDLNILNWEPMRKDVRGNVTITKDPLGTRFELAADKCKIHVIASLVYLNSVSAVSGLEINA